MKYYVPGLAIMEINSTYVGVTNTSSAGSADDLDRSTTFVLAAGYNFL